MNLHSVILGRTNFLDFNHAPEGEERKSPIRWFDKASQVQHEQAKSVLQLLDPKAGDSASVSIAQYLNGYLLDNLVY